MRKRMAAEAYAPKNAPTLPMPVSSTKVRRKAKYAVSENEKRKLIHQIGRRSRWTRGLENETAASRPAGVTDSTSGSDRMRAIPPSANEGRNRAGKLHLPRTKPPSTPP